MPVFRRGKLSKLERLKLELLLGLMLPNHTRSVMGVRVQRLGCLERRFLVGPGECASNQRDVVAAADEIVRLVTTDAIAQCPDRPQLGGCRTHTQNGGPYMYCGRSTSEQ